MIFGKNINLRPRRTVKQIPWV